MSCDKLVVDLFCWSEKVFFETIRSCEFNFNPKAIKNLIENHNKSGEIWSESIWFWAEKTIFVNKFKHKQRHFIDHSNEIISSWIIGIVYCYNIINYSAVKTVLN